jgi:hypothetical protein
MYCFVSAHTAPWYVHLGEKCTLLREIVKINNVILCWLPESHTYNPSYLGGRDQEDGGSNPAWGNSSRDPI